MQTLSTRRRWWLEATEIQTERLVLRAISPADAGELGSALWTHRHHLAPWIDVPRVERGAPWWQQRTRQLASAFAVGSPLLYTVRNARGDFLGCAGLTLTAGSWALSYWLVATHTGRGYAREAAAALTRLAFEHAGARRLLIQCRRDNLRSAAVARALGFARTRVHHGVQHWTLTRDPRPATRDPRPATRDPRPATRDPRPATRPVMRDATPAVITTSSNQTSAETPCSRNPHTSEANFHRIVGARASHPFWAEHRPGSE